jgi:hypothetical protein
MTRALPKLEKTKNNIDAPISKSEIHVISASALFTFHTKYLYHKGLEALRRSSSEPMLGSFIHLAN